MKLKSKNKFTDSIFQFLIIESDENDTGGYFLYYYKEDNSAYDSWFKYIDDAFEAARTEFGIGKEDWEELH